MSLHKSPEENSHLDSTVAYQVNYYPWSSLSENAKRKIAWHKTVVYTKHELLAELNEDKTVMYLADDSSQFILKWEFGNVPTQRQWDDLESDQLIRVQFRISGLAEDTGRIALLSLIGFGASQLKEERYL